MSRCFVSYRHVAPDQDLARAIGASLTRSGNYVFMDTDIEVGARWVEEIEREIHTAEFFMVLLSSESVRSDMVRQEIQLAHRLAADGRLVILPVRVAFTGDLPYDLASYLNPLQYSLWNAGERFDRVCTEIETAIRRRAVLPEQQGPGARAEAADSSGAPLPVADPRPVLETGTVKPQSPFYVRREADTLLDADLEAGGATVIVKAPRQYGKSSLAVRPHVRARATRAFSCYLDFQFLEESDLGRLADLLAYLGRRVARAIREFTGDTAALPDRWDKDSFTEFLEDSLLARSSTPVLLILDEVDRVFGTPYRDDFFAMVRGWHNRRALDERWESVNLVIAHSTEPSLWIQDLNLSPFNVGRRLHLEGFSTAQIRGLNELQGRPLAGDGEIEQLRTLVDGQPYLVRQALYSMSSQRLRFPDFERTVTDERGPFGDHLRRVLWSLHQSKDLTGAIPQIFSFGTCEREDAFQRLLSAGLIKGETRRSVAIRSPLYERYLRRHT